MRVTLAVVLSLAARLEAASNTAGPSRSKGSSIRKKLSRKSKKESDKTVTEAMRGVTDTLSGPGISAGLTGQVTEARAQSAENYDLKAMNLVPMTGLPLRAAGSLVTGNSFLRRNVRGLVSRKTFKDIGVSELKAFAAGLDVERMKWPIYKIGLFNSSSSSYLSDEEARSSEAGSDSNPSQDGILDRRSIRTYRSIEEYHNAYKEGRLSPVDVAGTVYEWMITLDEEFHFMVEQTPWSTVKKAAQASKLRYERGEQLSKLDGIPFIVKDEMSIQNFTELVGTNPRNSKNPRLARPATKNDPVVQALLDAGAILFGTSVMHEYGISPVGYNVWYHGPLNAFDRTRYTGGSSSGSATGVALGLFPFAIGFDGGGSVRDPASWSGVDGAIPTFGTVRYHNAETEVFTTLHCGPITANVADAAIVMSVIANTKNQGDHFYDKVYRDQFEVPRPKINFAPLYEKNPNFTIGYDTAWVHDSDPEIETMFYEVHDWIQEQPGWSIKDNFVMTHWKDQALAHTLTIAAEFHQTHKDDEYSILEPNTKISLALGSEIDEETIAAAEKVKRWASEKWMEQFEKMDVIMTPAMAIPAQPIGSGVSSYGLFDGTLVSNMLKYIWPSNLLGFPSVTVTVRNNKDELPIGIQVICRPFEDGKCLALAKKIEEHYTGKRKTPWPWGVDDNKRSKWAWVDVFQVALAEAKKKAK
ncbi:hypothetical protein FOZ62_024187 [Perkinsus olseni]|uniref:Amidase domain-containing protein n=1 Tax=Perkinsus olseni TaxID=32597 RepID=A0A7J6PWX7_PEROL|nr:hypothetical protein FOZ62_024187 [Perkinsus olseni]